MTTITRRRSPWAAAVTHVQDADGKATWLAEVLKNNVVYNSRDFDDTEEGRQDAMTFATVEVAMRRRADAERCLFPLPEGACDSIAVTADVRCCEHRGLDLAARHRRIAAEYVACMTRMYDGRPNVAVHTVPKPHSGGIVTITTGTITSLLEQVDHWESEAAAERLAFTQVESNSDTACKLIAEALNGPRLGMWGRVWRILESSGYVREDDIDALIAH
ncbi:hypothetical protein SEA_VALENTINIPUFF_23 [Microbacterium phage ValentiniPuff]|uniref:Uncharacterized protein n=1 Tax=Microbacterium phage ValentiniPuff TaxID=2315705 RepID=A0A386KPG4_9CAUD|nr:hypothetical protein SEA_VALENTINIPUFF_23 [Microbacterium phage ValentiniPuff]